MADKNPVGAPTKYNPDFCATVIEYGKQGLSKAQIAARLDVHRETLNNWAETHPEFFDAIKKATNFAQDLWEQRFALGAMGANEDGQQMNPTMMIFLMKNRFPADWREKQTTEHEVNGAKKMVIEWGE